MATPQKKGWFSWFLSPRARVGDVPDGASAPVNPRSASVAFLAKGKGKSLVAEALPPLRALLGENGSDVAGGAGDVEVLLRFGEAGLLDESLLQRRKRRLLFKGSWHN